MTDTYEGTAVPRFAFPALGNTGEGDPPYPADYSIRPSDRVYGIWQSQIDGSFAVSHQHDRPACAYRCHYPGGGAPCDLETAMRFVAHVTAALTVDWVLR